uniref:Putative membrane protein insertion efficiency factor n=1 Tax=Aureimonas frigidaquae TaxID=424757 RepID=A0A0P0Z268_9HYPH|nr:membrane protein insertion efficiency factor YidD [Aureimonas frigidaquae]BAT28141.1 UPF0161 protein [Aureimonas frigidaquae]
MGKPPPGQKTPGPSRTLGPSPKTLGRNWPGPFRKTPGRLLGLGLVRTYQLAFSPLVGGHCRHVPTCSEYAYEAVARHGLVAGSFLTGRRVARCGPFGCAGHDPVPERFSWRPPHR